MKRPMVAFLTLLATCHPVAAHVGNITSLDLFVARTISFKLLYGLVILRHARRRLVTISVTTNPTAEWIAGQVTDAFGGMKRQII